jgi:hypothetical protein
MRGKKGYRARSYAGFRRARVAPRGRMSAGAPWQLYLILILCIGLMLAVVWRHYRGH